MTQGGKDNSDDMYERGRNRRVHGESNPRAKLSVADVLEMRRLRQAGSTVAEIARRFGVNDGHASRGLTWKQLNGLAPNERPQEITSSDEADEHLRNPL